MPNGNKQDLQALNTGQNTLQNVIGAVGQGLVPALGGVLSGALAGSGTQTQALLAGFAPALASGTPEAAQQTQNSGGGMSFPSPNGISNPPLPSAPPGVASFNADGTVNQTDLNGYPQGSM